MRAVLVGSDLMYRRDGSLAPIEINTNVGWDEGGRVEPISEVFNLADIKAFVEAHNIEKIYLEGIVNKAFTAFKAEFPALTVQSISRDEYDEKSEEENALAIRTFYSDEALVDSFCRDKINFLKSIKGTSLEVEYLLKTEEGLEGEITDLNLYEDNLPNFILKGRYPAYDSGKYPAFFRFESMEDLMDFVESDKMPEDFFLMPFYYCPEKLYSGERIQLIRNWSIYVANDEGGLDSIYVGKYTKVCGKINPEELVWNEDGSLAAGREMLLTNIWVKASGNVLMELDDLVWMEDGSWKKASELEEGDRIMSMQFPTEGDVDITKHAEVDYNISLEELAANSSYTINTIQSVDVRQGFFNIIQMIFTDGTDWFDTERSSYPILDPEDGTVMFRELKNLKVGDQVILAKLTNEIETPVFEVKEIESLRNNRQEFEGISVSTDGSHLVLTRTSEDAGAYISIEHNASTKYRVAKPGTCPGRALYGKEICGDCYTTVGCYKQTEIEGSCTCDAGSCSKAIEYKESGGCSW